MHRENHKLYRNCDYQFSDGGGKLGLHLPDPGISADGADDCIERGKACAGRQRRSFGGACGLWLLAGKTGADVALTVEPGQKIALVGYNGSGKTTLVKLLLRLYDPDSGKICYHGNDIRDYQVMAYRRSVGSVFQDFKIYAASLKENVLMDVENGSREESYGVEQALYDAHFTLEDNRLSYQIETPLTTEFEKDGINLSGGEAQKVAIARTLYRKQDLIIMDEPSSALDPLAEYRLNQELNEIAKDKTVIFISHRLSTVRDADCIYMMENGRIVESGTHEQLLSKGGKYAAMWKMQAGLYADVSRYA